MSAEEIPNSADDLARVNAGCPFRVSSRELKSPARKIKELACKRCPVRFSFFRDLLMLPNLGEKSLREVREKLAALGFTLGMTLKRDAYRAAILATVVASIQTTQGSPRPWADRRRGTRRQEEARGDVP